MTLESDTPHTVPTLRDTGVSILGLAWATISRPFYSQRREQSVNGQVTSHDAKLQEILRYNEEIRRRRATRTRVQLETKEDEIKLEQLAIERHWSFSDFAGDRIYGFDKSQREALTEAGVQYHVLEKY